MRASLLIATAVASLGLAGCDKEPLLEGERLDIRAPLPPAPENTAEAQAEIAKINAAAPAPIDPKLRITRADPVSNPGVAFRAPAQVNHGSWTHRGGSVTHRIDHPALGSTLTPVWSARIGEGNSRKARITADPVAGGGRIYTLDAHANVMAHTASGAPVWSTDLTPPEDNSRDASGGGLALDGNRLYVTTGFGKLTVLDAATGAQIWVQDFDAPVSGGPTVSGGLVYVASRDSRAFAVRTDNGRLEWQQAGIPAASVTVNGAAPAVTDRFAIFPYGSAEVVGHLKRGGLRMWGTTLAGQRRGRAYAGVSDVTADPVVVGNTVYAGSPAGRLAAFDVASGETLWTATEGAMSPVWPASGSLFLVNDQGQLVRLDASDGSVIWAVDMPFYTQAKARRQLAVVPHFGPILAGGRLYVGSGDNLIRAFDPANGALVANYDLPGGAASNPIVVDRTLYIVSARGTLHAYR